MKKMFYFLCVVLFSAQCLICMDDCDDISYAAFHSERTERRQDTQQDPCFRQHIISRAAGKIKNLLWHKVEVFREKGLLFVKNGDKKYALQLHAADAQDVTTIAAFHIFVDKWRFIHDTGNHLFPRFIFEENPDMVKIRRRKEVRFSEEEQEQVSRLFQEVQRVIDFFSGKALQGCGGD